MVLAAFALAPLLFTVTPAQDASGINWVSDDWAKAKAQALEAKQLVAVDVWATWCHTCLSMKHFVFTDAAMAKAAPALTWAMMDFDLPVNGEFFARHPITAFPTFLVIDPKTDAVVARWVGSGTAQQMVAFFGGADRASKDPLVLGHRALAREDWKGARKIFEAALAKKPGSADERTRLLAGYIESLWKLDPKACAEVGFKHLGETENTAPGIDFASFVAGCAEELPAPRKAEVLNAVKARLEPIALRGDLPLAIDDRSGMLETLGGVYEALGDKEAARKSLEARAALLDEAAAKAEDIAARAVFDAHRLDCYLQLGRYADAEKMLTESEAAQPQDFNHPWRLAVLFLKQQKTEPGLAAIGRGLQRGYGGRKLRLYSTKIDLLVQKKSYAEARATIEAAKKEIGAMNPKLVRPSWLKELEAKTEAIGKAEKSQS